MTRKIQNMEPDEIRILLIRAKTSQAAIAREKGCKPSAIYKVITGESVSDDIRKRIASKVGIDIRRIWPDPYLYGSARKRGRPFSGGHQAAV